MSARLSPEREQEIRETHPGGWYDGPWTQDYVDAAGDEPDYCRVVHHESGTTLAELPDFAGPIALFIADAHDAIPELLDELAAVRAERDEARAQLSTVAEFVAKRAEVITAINNCHPNNAHDYNRWQGHAEARRQLAQQLGLPVAWPADYEQGATS
ncbi:hypothetical protein ACFV90_36985 [Streptomyces sp. NPDC059904]|uniref:hypothetical protein n=1 Tax=Streptomyces sp. NPDC059904 TaxID=3346996 RepID=UPI003652E038